MIPFSAYQESAAFLKEKTGDFVPEVLLVLGSGLGFLADAADAAVTIDYGDIPGFGTAGAPGHRGRLVFGRLGGKNCAIMQGRMHYYEGYSMEEIVFPLCVLRLLGVKTLLITNAAGAVNRDFSPCEIMMVTDHIKLAAESPLRGENLPDFGPRFNDMTGTYTKRLRELARSAASELQIRLHEGVYMFFAGPQYETPAEIRAAAMLGADAVGMSTVPEVIAARHMGMETLGFSLLSNMAAGITGNPLSEGEVLAAGEAAKEHFSALVLECLKRM